MIQDEAKKVKGNKPIMWNMRRENGILVEVNVAISEKESSMTDLNLTEEQLQELVSRVKQDLLRDDLFLSELAHTLGDTRYVDKLEKFVIRRRTQELFPDFPERKDIPIFERYSHTALSNRRSRWYREHGFGKMTASVLASKEDLYPVTLLSMTWDDVRSVNGLGIGAWEQIQKFQVQYNHLLNPENEN